jgi:NADH dehydrogenase
MGVEVRTSSRVDRIEPGHVLLESGEGIESRTIVWSAGVRGVELAKDLTRSPAHGGRVPVTPELRLPDDPDVYVIGDLAYVDGELPMMAPVAIQQARTAVDNILRGAEGRPLRSFRYKNRGMMATIGRKSAVATLYGRNFKGYFAWAIWLVVHLFWLIGFRNKLVVLINWIYHYFRYERGVRLITRTPARQPADSRMPAKSAPRDDSGSEGRGS